ncbi:type II toxin-antitoxin system RatA family toxin [Aliidiomarina quisquiliarum]|uniref:type II toxin-antitoxin system RatA family toxin n=1 Tax=Aliidiomarina quisquiliarum TaxID=2938947 RepID=UPI00208E960B|nr:type II toxin-antitoxin system RatA family toxin [Aliidiomarina quisquiliarum]MCO4321756.1 type II toxin-antitoxin system RatA family toxin [Aliidiomarina quisquiliarum]
MSRIERSALVPYSDYQMFLLVNDVARYPEFVPSCEASRIISETEQEIVAELSISKAGIRHAFTTRNILTKPTEVRLELVDGPFKRLSGSWEFQALAADACKVTLRLDFEFSSKLLHFAFGKVFNEVTSRMVDAFAQRARQVYGHGK